MRLLAALAVVVTLSLPLSSAHAIALPNTPTSIVHIGISDTGEYMIAVAHDGMPSTLWIRSQGDVIGLSLRYAGPHLLCSIKRGGAHPFAYDGEVEQSRGRAVVVGRFPSDKGGTIDLKVRVTDGSFAP